MPSGGNYVSNRYAGETYEEVSAYSISTYNNTIPSGATVVQGVYYKWNDSGFTGQGWMTNVGGGPTAMYPDFKDDDDVEAYVAQNGNLDAVFSYWSGVYDLDGWDAFYQAVGTDSGCMDVYHGE